MTENGIGTFLGVWQILILNLGGGYLGVGSMLFMRLFITVVLYTFLYMVFLSKNVYKKARLLNPQNV